MATASSNHNRSRLSARAAHNTAGMAIMLIAISRHQPYTSFFGEITRVIK